MVNPDWTTDISSTAFAYEQALQDALVNGCGYIKVLPTGTSEYVPFDKITETE